MIPNLRALTCLVLVLFGCSGEADEARAAQARAAQAAAQAQSEAEAAAARYAAALEAKTEVGAQAAPSPAESVPAPTPGVTLTDGRVSYPILCDYHAVPAGLVAVANTDNLCIPASEAGIIAATDNWPSSFSYYSDDNPFSLFLGPVAVQEETSELSASERATITNRLKATRYHSWGIGETCTPTFTGAVSRLSISCEVGNASVFVGSSPPRVTKEQECETVPGGSCGECDTSEDCQPGLFSGCIEGCERSRCVFGQCTACPSERMCDDPTFEVNVPLWNLRAQYTDDVLKARAEEIASGNSNWTLLLGVRPTRAFRQVDTRRPTAEEIENEEYERSASVLVNDSEYYLGITVDYAAYVRCGDACDPVGKDVLVLQAARSTQYSIRAADHRLVRVTCTSGTCTGTAVEF